MNHIWRAGFLRRLWHWLRCRCDWTQFSPDEGETSCLKCGFVFMRESGWMDKNFPSDEGGE